MHTKRKSQHYVDASPLTDYKASPGVKTEENQIKEERKNAVTQFSKIGNLGETQSNHFQVKPSVRNLKREQVFSRITESMNEVKEIMDKLPRHVKRAQEVNDKDLKELARIIQGQAADKGLESFDTPSHTMNYSNSQIVAGYSPNIGRIPPNVVSYPTAKSRPMSTKESSNRPSSNYTPSAGKEDIQQRNYMFIQKGPPPRVMYNTPAEMKAAVRKGLPSAHRAGPRKDK